MAIEKPTLISKSMVKPSLSTPTHERTYKLSFLDQIAHHFYMPIVLFYQNPTSSDDVPSRVKKSLSEILTHYYPLAGRLKSTGIVDCNDEGVDFYEAQAECSLAEVMEKREPKTMELFSPPGMLFNESFKGSPFIVQFTRFKCGGVAISGSMLHKISDASGVSGFFSDWAAVSRGEEVSPVFLSPKIATSTFWVDIPRTPFKSDICVTKRFIFESPKIAQLKDMAAKAGIGNASRVQVVFALLYKCIMAASKATRLGTSRISMLMQTVNLRPKVNPPLTENSLGNFSWIVSIKSKDENDQGFESIVEALMKALKEFSEKYGNGKTLDGCSSLVFEALVESRKVPRGNNGDLDVYMCTSLCRFPFNKMDFGWGQPIWVGNFASPIKNTILLMDSFKPGGIEAMVTLEEKEMAILENDAQLLSFATADF